MCGIAIVADVQDPPPPRGRRETLQIRLHLLPKLRCLSVCVARISSFKSADRDCTYSTVVRTSQMRPALASCSLESEKYRNLPKKFLGKF